MSGIKNLKAKSKIQLDEMFDPKPVGKPEIQKDGKEEIKQPTQMDIQQVNEVLKRYVKKKEKDLDLLYQYAGQFGIQKIVREYIEVLL